MDFAILFSTPFLLSHLDLFSLWAYARVSDKFLVMMSGTGWFAIAFRRPLKLLSTLFQIPIHVGSGHSWSFVFTAGFHFRTLCFLLVNNTSGSVSGLSLGCSETPVVGFGVFSSRQLDDLGQSIEFSLQTFIFFFHYRWELDLVINQAGMRISFSLSLRSFPTQRQGNFFLGVLNNFLSSEKLMFR